MADYSEHLLACKSHLAKCQDKASKRDFIGALAEIDNLLASAWELSVTIEELTENE